MTSADASSIAITCPKSLLFASGADQGGGGREDDDENARVAEVLSGVSWGMDDAVMGKRIARKTGLRAASSTR